MIMEYTLEDLIDINLLQDLQAKLNLIYSFPSAIVDNDGKFWLLWRGRTCAQNSTGFIPGAKRVYKKRPVHPGTSPWGKSCGQLSMSSWFDDTATPIIIGGKHLGNFFTGQFFLEKPDLEFFRIKQNHNRFRWKIIFGGRRESSNMSREN